MDEQQMVEELDYLLAGETIGGEVLTTITSPEVPNKFLIWVGPDKCFEVTVEEVKE